MNCGVFCGFCRGYGCAKVCSAQGRFLFQCFIELRLGFEESRVESDFDGCGKVGGAFLGRPGKVAFDERLERWREEDVDLEVLVTLDLFLCEQPVS